MRKRESISMLPHLCAIYETDETLSMSLHKKDYGSTPESYLYL